jgi:hypothetical protein
MLQKRILNVLILVLLMITLQGCNNYKDAGIIEWTFKDEQLDWKDVKDAAYYEILFYEDDLVTETTLFAYSSEYSFYGFQADITYNLKIKVHYFDETAEESDFIQFSINREFQYPYLVGGNYIRTDLTWYDCSYFTRFVDYTLRINDEEYTLDTNEYDMSDYDYGIYQIQVKANYESGSSDWTEILYLPLLQDDNRITVNYSITSGEDIIYTFDGDISIEVVQEGHNGVADYSPLPESIVTIDGSTFTINKYYIQNLVNSENRLLMIFRVFTNDNEYNVYVMNSDILE